MSNVFKACRKCTERTVGCHSWCKRHAAEKKKHEELMVAVRDEVDMDHYFAKQCEKHNHEEALYRKRRQRRRVR